ncbi:MAG: ComEC/Rec2 family competence protein, partial [Planctomycetota bacterium]
MRERPLLALAIGAVAGILIHRAGLPAAAATGLALPVLAGAIVLWRRGQTIDAGILLTALLVAGIAGGRAELLNARRARLAAAWSAWEGGRARLRLVEPPLLLQPPPGAPRADRLAFDAVLLPAPPGEPPDLPATATPPQEASRRAQSANPPQPAPQTDTASGEDAPQADEESAVGPPDPLAGARVRLYVDTDEADDPAHWRPGQVVSAVVRPGRLRPSATPGAFSVADYHARERLVGSGGAAAVRPQGPADSGGPGALLFDLRRVLVRAVFAAYNAPASNVLAAVLLGYREGVSPELRTPFRRTGTGHLLAVSGLHVGLVTGLAWFLARRLRAGPRGAALAGIAVCLLYLGLT